MGASIRRLIALLLTDEHAAQRWYAGPPSRNILDRLREPTALLEITETAAEFWPPPFASRLEIGNRIAVGSVELTDHSIAMYAEAKLDELAPPSGPHNIHDVLVFRKDAWTIWWALVPQSRPLVGLAPSQAASEAMAGVMVGSHNARRAVSAGLH